MWICFTIKYTKNWSECKRIQNLMYLFSSRSVQIWENFVLEVPPLFKTEQKENSMLDGVVAADHILWFNPKFQINLNWPECWGAIIMVSKMKIIYHHCTPSKKHQVPETAKHQSFHCIFVYSLKKSKYCIKIRNVCLLWV